jgi:hypothetical protein
VLDFKGKWELHVEIIWAKSQSKKTGNKIIIGTPNRGRNIITPC